jgi:uncharacterized protein (DUF1684 family)
MLMMKNTLLAVCLFAATICFSQTSYEDSMRTYLSDYVQNHEVVKGHNKSHMQFYDVSKTYRVIADFKPSSSAGWITFKTSGVKDKIFRLYGTASFNLDGKMNQLNIYQSQQVMGDEKYKDYLFLPFTDSTSGNETYISGRYIDLKTSDIQNKKLVLDFNRAYNPYCAYVSGLYNCPIPPKENALSIAIKAGEKAFKTSH